MLESSIQLHGQTIHSVEYADKNRRSEAPGKQPFVHPFYPWSSLDHNVPVLVYPNPFLQLANLQLEHLFVWKECRYEIVL